MLKFAKYRSLYYCLAFWRLARPLQLVAFVALYLIGIIVAYDAGYGLSMERCVCGLIPLLLAGASIHYSNEYADVETDKLTQRTPYSGGSGVIAEGILPAEVIRHGMLFLLLITIFSSSMCLIWGLLTITAFLILLCGLFLGWMYSLPPLKLGWRGWGELDNALLGGVALVLYGYAVVTNSITRDLVLMFLPFVGFVFNNLLATTWADREADRMVGKLTLATRLSPISLRRLYAGVVILTYALLVALADWIIPLEIVIGGVLISPMVIWGYVRYTKMHSPHPSVYAMIAMMLVYFVGWLSLIF